MFQSHCLHHWLRALKRAAAHGCKTRTFTLSFAGPAPKFNCYWSFALPRVWYQTFSDESHPRVELPTFLPTPPPPPVRQQPLSSSLGRINNGRAPEGCTYPSFLPNLPFLHPPPSGSSLLLRHNITVSIQPSVTVGFFFLVNELPRSLPTGLLSWQWWEEPLISVCFKSRLSTPLKWKR